MSDYVTKEEALKARIKELEDAGRTLMARLQTSEIQAIKGAARVAELEDRNADLEGRLFQLEARGVSQ